LLVVLVLELLLCLLRLVVGVCFERIDVIGIS
jgi:hypothetical protein